ncbi:hypothetical protein Hanom_Chr04g00307481 [Helianthus anomalus]
MLWMMLGRMSMKARPVLREKNSEEAPLWRMFYPYFKGEVDIVACADDEERFNRTIRNNFRLPDRAALEAELPQGKGDVGALRDPAVAGVPNQTVLKLSDKRQRKPKKPHEAVVVPPLVPEVAGGVTAAGESTTGAEPVDVKKRKGGAPAAGGQKAPKLRKTRATAIPKTTPAVTTVDVEVQKKGRRSPSIEVVTPPSVHAEDTVKKTAGETIVDMLDSSNNLIDPHDAEGQGARSRSPLLLKNHSFRLPRARGLRIDLPFSLARLNWSFITAPIR